MTPKLRRLVEYMERGPNEYVKQIGAENLFELSKEELIGRVALASSLMALTARTARILLDEDQDQERPEGQHYTH